MTAQQEACERWVFRSLGAAESNDSFTGRCRDGSHWAHEFLAASAVYIFVGVSVFSCVIGTLCMCVCAAFLVCVCTCVCVKCGWVSELVIFEEGDESSSLCAKLASTSVHRVSDPLR